MSVCQPSGYSTTLRSEGDQTATGLSGVFSLPWVADISGAAVYPCVRLPLLSSAHVLFMTGNILISEED